MIPKSSRARVEFCGGIGAGKSTVARLLAAHRQLPLIEEHYEQVPFWAEFYQNPELFAFEKNISFLLFHSKAIRSGEARIGDPLICDFALFQDVAYAAIQEPLNDYHATLQVHDSIIDRIGQPDLIIFVTCDRYVQLDRIRRRGREPEQSITIEYLDLLSDSILNELDKRISGTPVIQIDTGEFDFVVDPNIGLSVLSQEFERWLSRRGPTT